MNEFRSLQDLGSPLAKEYLRNNTGKSRHFAMFLSDGCTRVKDAAAKRLPKTSFEKGGEKVGGFEGIALHGASASPNR